MKKVFNKIAKLTLGITLALGSMQLFPVTAKATNVNVRSGDQMPSTETDGAFWYNGVKAENGLSWSKTRVVKDNTLKARSYFFPTHNLETALSTANSFDFSQSNYYQKLSGTNWQFKLVNKPSEVITNFHEVGFDASEFKEIPVPSSWQFYTDDAPGYSNHYYIWGQHHPSPNGAIPNIEAINYRNIANGTAPTEYNPVGHYIKTFEVKDTLKANDRYILNFQGVESAYYVYLNGRYIGYSEDSFTQHEFDVTDAIQAGENKLAVLVYRFSDGSFLENQDFIRLSGIFRDVILFSKSSHAALDDFTLDTTFNADYTQANVAIKTVLSGDLTADAQVKAMLYDGEQKVTETTITGNEGVLTVDNPKLWSDEHPNLYTVVFEVSVNGKSEFVAMEYGLREIKKLELANGKHTYGINGKRLMFRGVDRHELSPDEGRAVSKEWMVKDIELMKQYNINAIRTSHYPNSPMLYHLANQYGILILDEANLETHAAGSWIPKDVEEFRYPSLHRMENVFERDKNFSSVVAWSLGNEAEYGTHPAVTNNYYAKLMNSYVKERDSKRPIINERDNREGIVDVRSNMYSSYGNDAAILAGNDPRPYLQIEYAHAMGQSTGYYKKYWDTWRRFENSMGGFIWDWVDQSPLWRIPEVKNTTITRVLPVGELTNINGEIDETTQSLRGNYVYEDGSLADFSGADQVFSLYAEVKPSNVLQHNTIMTHGDNQYLMRMNATNQLEFYIRTTSNWQGVVTQPVTFESDGFVKIGLTFNKGETNVFVNGEKVATKTLENNINKEANSKLGIGKDYSLGRPFDGLIRKIAIYNSEKDFTTATVTASDSDLVVYQDFSSANVTTTITKAPSPGYKLKCKDGSLDCYYAYGGDFGLDRYNNDHNFLDNGLVSPDRQPHSGLQQVKYVQQFIQFIDFNVNEKSVTVKNEFNFTNLSDYDIFYYLVKDGVKLDEKKLDLDLAPNQRQKVTFDYGNLEEDKEYYLNVEVRTKQDTKWAQAGYVIAYDQFALSKADTSAIIVTPDTDATLKDITVNESGNTVTLTNGTFTLTIDKEKGKITQYSFGGKDFFNGDAHLNVYRPPVDNDRETGGYFNTTAKFVDAHNGTVNDFSINKENAKRITIQIDSTFKNGVGTAREFLHVYGNGRVIFDQEYNLASNNEIPAIGRMFDLKKEFEKLTYYGRGFEDNYVDRYEGYPMGVYETTPDLSIGGFVRPQDSGNKTGVRWAAIKNDVGQGLLFAARSNDLEVAMNRYDQADIRTSLHPYKLTPTDSTFFRVNLKTAGVGGQDSWGSRPEGYARVRSGVHRYSFEMMPLGEPKSNDEYSHMAKEKVLFNALVKRVLIDGKVLDVFNQDSLVYSDLEGTTVNLELFDESSFKVEKTVTGNQVVIEVKNLQGEVIKRYEFNFKDKAKLNMNEVVASVEADSEGPHGNEGPADFARDGNLDTFWHSPWHGNITYPLDYVINLKNKEDVSGLLYFPRTGGGNNGIITSYDIVSVNEDNTETVLTSGEWAGNQEVKKAEFNQIKSNKIIVRIKSALSNDASKKFASAAEFVLLKDNILKKPFKVTYKNNLDSSTINFSDSGLLDDYSLTVNELAANDYDTIVNKLKAQPYSLVDSQIKFALDLKLFKNGELVDFNDPNTNLGTTPIRVSIPLKPEYLPTETIKIYHGNNLEEINYTINNDTIEFNATAFSPYLLTNAKKYQVSFNTDGGNEINSKYVLPNTMVSLPDAPEKEGFEFLGWTLNGEIFNAETLINKDIELLANWKEKPKSEPDPVDSGSTDKKDNKTSEETKQKVNKNVNTFDNTNNFALGLFMISVGALLIAYRRKFKKD